MLWVASCGLARCRQPCGMIAHGLCIPDPHRQVHRFEFALVIFHSILALLVLGVKSTKAKRAAVQNG
jgi:hypothetical protein